MLSKILIEVLFLNEDFDISWNTMFKWEGML